MIEIWAVLLPILIADILNPVLFAFMVYAAGTRRPVANASAILLGHTLAYFSAGVVLALGLEQIAERLSNPRRIDFVLGLLVGCLLLWVAFPSRDKTKRHRPEEPKDLTVVKAIGLGAIVNFVGIPFALPYFAALDQILKADLAFGDSLIILTAYNLLYALPFVAVPILVAALGGRSRPLLERVNELLDRVSSYLMPLLFFLVGAALVADAVTYFASGAGLF